MSILLAFKLTLVPAFLLLLSLAGRRWGTVASGWLVGLPVVAGPIVYFIGVEQGEAFAADAARGTVVGIVSLMLFCLAYSRVAVRYRWPVSLLSGWTVFFVSTGLLSVVPLGLLPSFAGAVAAVPVVRALLPAALPEEGPPQTGRAEIVARMAAAVAMVLLMTALAQPLGPRLAGMLVPFPVAATVLTVFTHRFHGGASAIHLLRGLVSGLWTMALFFLIVAGTVRAIGLPRSFALATAVDLLIHAAAFRVLRGSRAARAQ